MGQTDTINFSDDDDDDDDDDEYRNHNVEDTDHRFPDNILRNSSHEVRKLHEKVSLTHDF